VIFPVRGGKTWELTQTLVDKWGPAYPRLDIAVECQKALVWCEAHPTRRKTARGMERFLVAWLNRAEPPKRTVTHGGPKRDQAYWDLVYSWRDDCLKLHGGKCENYNQHDIELTKAQMKQQGLL
jgi:hypothetical protein